MFLVVPLFLECDGALPSLRQLFTIDLKFLCHFSRRRHLPLRTVVSDRGRYIGMEPIHGEEGAHTSRAVYAVIVCEFCQGCLLHPVILQVVAIAPEIVLEALVLSLCLSVVLRVIRCVQPPLDPKAITQLRPKRTRKDGTSIGDDTFWYPELRHDVLYKNVSQTLGSDRFQHGNIFRHLRISIYDNEETIKHPTRAISAGWQVGHKVHGDLLPLPGRQRKRLQSAIAAMPLHLCSLAYWARLDVLLYVLPHAWPPPASR